jgi:hypothetical protein
MSSADRETWIPEAQEPGIPERAPESAQAYALALDRMTGGDGAWARRVVAELGLVLGGIES